MCAASPAPQPRCPSDEFERRIGGEQRFAQARDVVADAGAPRLRRRARVEDTIRLTSRASASASPVVGRRHRRCQRRGSASRRAARTGRRGRAVPRACPDRRCGPRRRRRSRSAALTVARRCATTSVVRPARSRSSASCTARSLAASRLAVASSRIEELRVADQRPRDRDALALPAREARPALADLARVARAAARRCAHGSTRRAPRPRRRRRVAPGAPAGCSRRSVVWKRNGSCVTTAVASRNEARRNDASGRPSTVIRPIGRVVEAQQQVADRRLARARRPDQRDRRAPGDLERESDTTGVPGRYENPTPSKRTASRMPSNGVASAGSGGGGRQVEDLEDAIDARHRVVHAVHVLDEALGGLVEVGHLRRGRAAARSA